MYQVGSCFHLCPNEQGAERECPTPALIYHLLGGDRNIPARVHWHPSPRALSLNLRSKLHPARMVLKAEQHSQIADAYESAAADKSLPAQARAAFARKADWFRLLARVGEKREQAAVIASKAKQAEEPPPNPCLLPTQPRRWKLWARYTGLGAHFRGDGPGEPANPQAPQPDPI